jgi:glutathione synthase/RimK-type ligase-like ATP-grasp enzyme
VTNDPDRVREFLLQGPAVVKAIADARVVGDTGERHGQTQVLGDSDDLGGVRAAPVLVQGLVPKVADVRVTLVGGAIFAVRITTPPGAPIDFRATPSAEAAYEVLTLSDATLAPLREFVRFFGLRFAAFDFAEDLQGRLWFLECNPNGQWGWLEPPTGLDITGALVELLLNP